MEKYILGDIRSIEANTRFWEVAVIDFPQLIPAESDVWKSIGAKQYLVDKYFNIIFTDHNRLLFNCIKNDYGNILFQRCLLNEIKTTGKITCSVIGTNYMRIRFYGNNGRLYFSGNIFTAEKIMQIQRNAKKYNFFQYEGSNPEYVLFICRKEPQFVSGIIKLE